MDTVAKHAAAASKYGGYHQTHPNEQPDMSLRQTSRGTPGGEYLRRFWHPVAYMGELGELPLRVRALSEDLVVFRDGSGQVGCLHLHCCHRNTSLEFGVVEKNGLRCCYHGRLIAPDGTILEIPGESEEFRANNKVCQGSYPTHVDHGVVFVYMGPPERKPVFPTCDRFSVAGMKVTEGDRWPLACNWLQIRENTLDPAHTATLHSLPQYRGGKQFADEFGNFPDLMNWFETPGGMMYMAVRRVGDNIWVRSNECIGPTYSGVTSIFETGKVPKRVASPFLTMYLLPVDDFNSTRFYVNHIASDEAMPFEERRRLQNFGQANDRPYNERQYLPGDCEALEGQGPANDNRHEHLGGNDRGVAMFRRYIRRGIEDVQNGKDPHGVYFDAKDVPATLTNDYVCKATEIGGDPSDPAVLVKFTEWLLKDYLASPPVRDLIEGRVK
jgi:phenylpropionate dioxygenase-like ring-hydroxylating dioxygenase large terminal subunit